MYTRKDDILEIKELRKKAGYEWQRKAADRALNKIYRETPKIEKLRRKLIEANRGNCQRAVNYYTEAILKERR